MFYVQSTCNCTWPEQVSNVMFLSSQPVWLSTYIRQESDITWSLMFCLDIYPPKTCDKSITFADIALSQKEKEHTKSLITVHKIEIYNNKIKQTKTKNKSLFTSESRVISCSSVNASISRSYTRSKQVKLKICTWIIILFSVGQCKVPKSLSKTWQCTGQDKWDTAT